MPLQRRSRLAAVALAVGVGGVALTSATGSLESPRTALITAASALAGGHAVPSPADTAELTRQAGELRDQVEALQRQVSLAERATPGMTTDGPVTSSTPAAGTSTRRSTSDAAPRRSPPRTAAGNGAAITQPPKTRRARPTTPSAEPRSGHDGSDHESDDHESSEDDDD